MQCVVVRMVNGHIAGYSLISIAALAPRYFRKFLQVSRGYAVAKLVQKSHFEMHWQRIGSYVMHFCEDTECLCTFGKTIR